MVMCFRYDDLFRYSVSKASHVLYLAYLQLFGVCFVQVSTRVVCKWTRIYLPVRLGSIVWCSLARGVLAICFVTGLNVCLKTSRLGRGHCSNVHHLMYLTDWSFSIVVCVCVCAGFSC